MHDPITDFFKKIKRIGGQAYLWRRRNTPHRTNVHVTRIQPRITRLQSKNSNIGQSHNLNLQFFLKFKKINRKWLKDHITHK